MLPCSEIQDVHFLLHQSPFFEEYCSKKKLQPTDVTLSTYTREKIRPLGQVEVNVKKYLGSSYNLPLIIVPAGNTVFCLVAIGFKRLNLIGSFC